MKNTFKQFPATFWIANTMELFERWAWYGLFMVLALYLTKSTDEGALGFTMAQKGSLMGTVAATLYLLPIITGSLADKFGYKRTLFLAYIILASGYYMMGTFTDYTAVYFAFLFVGLGASLFKPVLSATITKTTNSENASIGFGIFYMMVNIGAFLGPLFSSKLRDQYGWKIVFIMSSIAILVNLVLLLLFYNEPERQKNNESVLKSITSAFKNIYLALKDFKLSLFLIIMVGFWTLLNQLYYTLPNFIDQWVDTVHLRNQIASFSPAFAQSIGNNSGGINPEMLLNLDAAFIILFQIIISSIAMRFKSVNVIITGTLVIGIGLSITVATGNPLYTILGLFIFSVGEMAASPKYTEYIGRIAPKEKTALYMGTSFLPAAAGNKLAGFISGTVYQITSDKTELLRTEVEKRGLDIPQISENFTQNQFYSLSAEKMNLSSSELTQFLWQNYQPYKIWYVFAGLMAVSVVALYLYNRFIIK